MTRHRTLLLWLLAFLPLTIPVPASADETPQVSFGLFLDGYYAFDANRPRSRDRSFTTLPARHNEFAINLAYLEGKLTADRMRARLALQTGTSVVANYSTEFRDATKTGSQSADVLQFLQEATAGYRLAEGLWIDAGIYFSHIGMEGFVSRDNWTYTRSLVADFSPYYQSGVRLSYDPNPRWSLQLHVLNGWQNIVETNDDKALGTQIVYRATERLSFTHNSFVGRETHLRVFQDFLAKYQATPWWETGVTLDYGLQRKSQWWGTSVLQRFRLAETTYVGCRLEYYSDPDGVIVPTGTPHNFQTVGASTNVDRQLTPQLLWRNEIRVLHARDAVFPTRSGAGKNTVFGVTSLALSL